MPVRGLAALGCETGITAHHSEITPGFPDFPAVAEGHAKIDQIAVVD
jgi:hypothetical protein